MKTGNIVIYAGKNAAEKVRDSGLKKEMVTGIAGAAGGPKWLVLYGMDRAILSWLPAKRKEPLFMTGSSIAAWRFAAYAGRNSRKSLETFRETYLSQKYSNNPDVNEISAETERIMNLYLNEKAESEILEHPYIRLNFFAVKCLNLLKSGNKIKLTAGMAAAGAMNFFSRKNLKYFFHRALFYDPRNKPPYYNMDEFPIQRIPLSKKNVKKALMASGSIPLVMKGIEDIDGAEKGVYRDGGMIDYHLDIPHSGDDNGLVLYPHYTSSIIPGWLDKIVPYRHPIAENFKNVLFIAPSPEFLKKLPFSKIPDRNDFKNFTGRDLDRINYWNSTTDASISLGEEFIECIESGRIKNMVKDFSF
jgi:hypothetical protein